MKDQAVFFLFLLCESKVQELLKYYCSTVTVLEVFSHNTLTVQCAAHCVPNADDTSNTATTADNISNANTANNTVFVFYPLV